MEQLHQSGEIIANRYRILNTLGQGGSSTTYLAEHLQTSEKIALKALSLHHINDWKTLELFKREAQVLSQLNHPAIPRYLEYFHLDTVGDRYFYIAQQLAPGQSLATLVQTGWRSTQNDVKNIAIQLLNILIYLQSIQPPVIHRDIKPQNIIRHSDDTVFLVDFGAVQTTYHSTLARSSTVVGTFGYMAPEQFIGQACPTTDLYGVGATLLFLLTHRSPADLPRNGLEVNFRRHVNLSEGFAQWLEKMLAPEVSARFNSAEDALSELHHLDKLSTKISYIVPKTFLIGVGAIAAISLGFQYFLPYTYKLTPELVCLSMQRGETIPFKRYLKKGGDPFAFTGFTKGDRLGLTIFFKHKKPTSILFPHCFQKAPKRAQRKMKKILVEHLTLNIHAKNDRGQTTLHWIGPRYNEFLGLTDTVELLISIGADINAKDNMGNTPLHTHLDPTRNPYRDRFTIELLIDSGADVNATNHKNQTPLHITIDVDLVERLIAAGADVNARDINGQTPLGLALQRQSELNKDSGKENNHKLIELLKRHGATE